MSKLLSFVILLGACTPDTSDAQDVCSQIVADGLKQCSQDAWDLCDRSYDQVLKEIQAENADLRQQLDEIQATQAAGCDSYVNGYMVDWLHAHQCNWEPQSQYGWVCYGGQLCQPFDPSNP